MKKLIFILTAMLSFSRQESLAICDNGSNFLGFGVLSKVCYKCMFPFRIGSIPVINGPMPDVNGNAAATNSIICICPMALPPFFRIGINVSYFLPDRLIETVKDPGCMPTMGFELPANSMLAGDSTEGSMGSKHMKQQSHLIMFNILELLSLLTDLLCVETSSFDIGYLTEFDPLWQSDEVAAFINPEAIVFSSVFAQLAVIPDSITSAAFTPLDATFWTIGSGGSAYPLSGSTDAVRDYVEGNFAIAQKLTYKLHRELIIWDESGKYNYCTKIPAPVWTKSNYRYQIVVPVSHFIGHVPGQTGMLWSFGKNPPVPEKADNFGFVLFKKRGCCAF